jgi:prevent-host-death family protein
MVRVPVKKLRKNLASFVAMVPAERVLITVNGYSKAALVSLTDLSNLEQLDKFRVPAEKAQEMEEQNT